MSAGMAGAALAQTAVAPVEVRSAGAGALGLQVRSETGSRLGLAPMDTPASVEIIAGDAIRLRGDVSVADAVGRAAGVTSVGTPGDGGGALSARGFSGPNSVMQLYDGVRLYVGAGTITFPFDTWTVDRIEVLRGPASVMFGEGAIGGAVNVVPKRPTSQTSAEFQVAGGSQQTWRAAGGAGGPIAGDALLFRIDASTSGSAGWVDRGRSRSTAVSGSLMWRPRPDLAFTLSHDYGDQSPQRYFGTPLIDHALSDANSEVNYNVADAQLNYRDSLTKLKADWSPSAAVNLRNDLYYLSTHRRWGNAESYAYDPTTRRVDRFDYIAIGHQESQIGDRAALTLNHDLGGAKNTLAIGGEVNSIRFTHASNTPFRGASTVDVANSTPGSFLYLDPYKKRFHTDTDQYALFAEDRLALTGALSLVGGLRLDHSRLTRTDLVSGAAFSKTLENVGWRVGAVYKPSPAVSLYAQYSTGSDPVGSLITLSASQSQFDLSTGRQVEAGVKAQFLGGKGEATLAAYHIVKEKLLVRDRTNPAVTQQVGQRSSKGLEASLALDLGAGFSIDANGALLDARFDDFTESVGGRAVSRNGNTPPNSPEATGNLFAVWAFLPAWQARVGVRAAGKAWSDNANTLATTGYAVVDASLGWKLTSRLALDLRLYNAFDKLYAPVAYNDEQWLLGRRRAVELVLSGRF